MYLKLLININCKASSDTRLQSSKHFTTAKILKILPYYYSSLQQNKNSLSHRANNFSSIDRLKNKKTRIEPFRFTNCSNPFANAAVGAKWQPNCKKRFRFDSLISKATNKSMVVGKNPAFIPNVHKSILTVYFLLIAYKKTLQVKWHYYFNTFFLTTHFCLAISPFILYFFQLSLFATGSFGDLSFSEKKVFGFLQRSLPGLKNSSVPSLTWETFAYTQYSNKIPLQLINNVTSIDGCFFVSLNPSWHKYLEKQLSMGLFEHLKQSNDKVFQELPQGSQLYPCCQLLSLQQASAMGLDVFLNETQRFDGKDKIKEKRVTPHVCIQRPDTANINWSFLPSRYFYQLQAMVDKQALKPCSQTSKLEKSLFSFAKQRPETKQASLNFVDHVTNKGPNNLSPKNEWTNSRYNGSTEYQKELQSKSDIQFDLQSRWQFLFNDLDDIPTKLNSLFQPERGDLILPVCLPEVEASQNTRNMTQGKLFQKPNPLLEAFFVRSQDIRTELNSQETFLCHLVPSQGRILQKLGNQGKFSLPKASEIQVPTHLKVRKLNIQVPTLLKIKQDSSTFEWISESKKRGIEHNPFVGLYYYGVKPGFKIRDIKAKTLELLPLNDKASLVNVLQTGLTHSKLLKRVSPDKVKSLFLERTSQYNIDRGFSQFIRKIIKLNLTYDLSKAANTQTTTASPVGQGFSSFDHIGSGKKGPNVFSLTESSQDLEWIKTSYLQTGAWQKKIKHNLIPAISYLKKELFLGLKNLSTPNICQLSKKEKAFFIPRSQPESSCFYTGTATLLSQGNKCQQGITNIQDIDIKPEQIGVKDLFSSFEIGLQFYKTRNNVYNVYNRAQPIKQSKVFNFSFDSLLNPESILKFQKCFTTSPDRLDLGSGSKGVRVKYSRNINDLQQDQQRKLSGYLYPDNWRETLCHYASPLPIKFQNPQKFYTYWQYRTTNGLDFIRQTSCDHIMESQSLGPGLVRAPKNRSCSNFNTKLNSSPKLIYWLAPSPNNLLFDHLFPTFKKAFQLTVYQPLLNGQSKSVEAKPYQAFCKKGWFFKQLLSIDHSYSSLKTFFFGMPSESPVYGCTLEEYKDKYKTGQQRLEKNNLISPYESLLDFLIQTRITSKRNPALPQESTPESNISFIKRPLREALNFQDEGGTTKAEKLSDYSFSPKKESCVEDILDRLGFSFIPAKNNLIQLITKASTFSKTTENELKRLFIEKGALSNQANRMGIAGVNNVGTMLDFQQCVIPYKSLFQYTKSLSPRKLLCDNVDQQLTIPAQPNDWFASPFKYKKSPLYSGGFAINIPISHIRKGFHLIEPMGTNQIIYFGTLLSQLGFAFIVLKLATILRDEYNQEFIYYITEFYPFLNEYEKNSLLDTLSPTDQKKFRVITPTLTKKKLSHFIGGTDLLTEFGEIILLLRNSKKVLSQINYSAPKPPLSHSGKDVGNSIDFTAVLPQQEEYKENWIQKGILLVGPPGCGKTLFVQALAGEATVPIILESGKRLTTNLFSNGSERLKDLFKTAYEMTPCILFLDEIDTIGQKREQVLKSFQAMTTLFPNRGSSQDFNASQSVGNLSHIHNVDANSNKISQVEEVYNPVLRLQRLQSKNAMAPGLPASGSVDNRATGVFSTFGRSTSQQTSFPQDKTEMSQKDNLGMLTQLLCELDGLNNQKARTLLVIGATNRPATLDAALTRPGRFGKILYLDLPGKQKRFELLKFYSGLPDPNKTTQSPDSTISQISRVTGRNGFGNFLNSYTTAKLEQTLAADQQKGSAAYISFEANQSTPLFCKDNRMGIKPLAPSVSFPDPKVDNLEAKKETVSGFSDLDKLGAKHITQLLDSKVSLNVGKFLITKVKPWISFQRYLKTSFAYLAWQGQPLKPLIYASPFKGLTKPLQGTDKKMGVDPFIQWDYFVNQTVGLSAAHLTAIMNQSALKAINNYLNVIDIYQKGGVKNAKNRAYFYQPTVDNLSNQKEWKLRNTTQPPNFTFSFSDSRFSFARFGETQQGSDSPLLHSMGSPCLPLHSFETIEYGVQAIKGMDQPLCQSNRLIKAKEVTFSLIGELAINDSRILTCQSAKLEVGFRTSYGYFYQKHRCYLRTLALLGGNRSIRNYTNKIGLDKKYAEFLRLKNVNGPKASFSVRLAENEPFKQNTIEKTDTRDNSCFSDPHQKKEKGKPGSLKQVFKSLQEYWIDASEKSITPSDLGGGFSDPRVSDLTFAVFHAVFDYHFKLNVLDRYINRIIKNHSFGWIFLLNSTCLIQNPFFELAVQNPNLPQKNLHSIYYALLFNSISAFQNPLNAPRTEFDSKELLRSDHSSENSKVGERSPAVSSDPATVKPAGVEFGVHRFATQRSLTQKVGSRKAMIRLISKQQIYVTMLHFVSKTKSAKKVIADNLAAKPLTSQSLIFDSPLTLFVLATLMSSLDTNSFFNGSSNSDLVEKKQGVLRWFHSSYSQQRANMTPMPVLDTSQPHRLLCPIQFTNVFEKILEKRFADKDFINRSAYYVSGKALIALTTGLSTSLLPGLNETPLMSEVKTKVAKTKPVQNTQEGIGPIVLEQKVKKVLKIASLSGINNQCKSLSKASQPLHLWSFIGSTGAKPLTSHNSKAARLSFATRFATKKSVENSLLSLIAGKVAEQLFLGKDERYNEIDLDQTSLRSSGPLLNSSTIGLEELKEFGSVLREGLIEKKGLGLSDPESEKLLTQKQIRIQTLHGLGVQKNVAPVMDGYGEAPTFLEELATLLSIQNKTWMTLPSKSGGPWLAQNFNNNGSIHQAWWQLKSIHSIAFSSPQVSQNYKDWYRLFVSEEKQNVRNIEWVAPDTTFHNQLNNTVMNAWPNFDSTIKLRVAKTSSAGFSFDPNKIANDQKKVEMRGSTDNRMGSQINQDWVLKYLQFSKLNWNQFVLLELDSIGSKKLFDSYNKVFIFLEQNRELMDCLVYSLMCQEKLRDFEILKVYQRFF